MDENDFDFLCRDLSAEEVKRIYKALSEWGQGDPNSFPVHLALFTKAQWHAAALIPRAISESGELIDRYLANCRQETAALVKNLNTVARDNIVELKSMIKAHAAQVNESGILVRNQLWETEAVAKQIAKELLVGSVEWSEAKKDFMAERQKLAQERIELAARARWRDTIYSLFILVGAVAFGVLLGYRLWH